MILSELLDYFEIEAELPQYLYSEPFNDVFMRGNLTKDTNKYTIVIETQRDVIHTMIINPDDDYPVVISSELPNGKTNGMKFGQRKGDLVYI